MSFVCRAWETSTPGVKGCVTIPVGACSHCRTLAILVALNVLRQQASLRQGHVPHTRSSPASVLNLTHAGAVTFSLNRSSVLGVNSF